MAVVLILNIFAFAAAGSGALAFLVTAALTISSLRSRRLGDAKQAPMVTLIRPCAGAEEALAEALETGFRLIHAPLTQIFCAEPGDPSIQVIEAVRARYPHHDSKLLVGTDDIGPNPKINNAAKGFRATTTEWLLLADSNALLPPDLIGVLLAHWRDKTGIVSTPTIMIEPQNLAADVECAFVNSFQMRWAIALSSIGIHSVLGKAMFWRRDAFERMGGIGALTPPADDWAAKSAVQHIGLEPRLAPPVFQHAGRRQLASVLRRQVRWCRAGRLQNPWAYSATFLGANTLPLAWLGVLAWTGALSAGLAVAMVAMWYAVEMALIRTLGWPLTWRTPIALILRDAAAGPTWLAGWLPRSIEWRGHHLVATKNDLTSN